jgi:uncharacterized protein involved in exopolysaccharide biosynthesis
MSGPSATEADDGIDLSAVGRTLWRYQRLVLLSAVICGLIAIATALIAVPVYRAETVISEVRDRGMGGGLASQFGGLASLAGVNLGGSAGSEAEAVLKSRRLIEEFIQRNSRLAELFRGGAGKPTLWRAVKRFKESVLLIREDKVTGLTTVSIDATDPATAAHWANEFVALANEQIRARAVGNAQRNIAYLNEQIAKTNEVELRRVMYNLIENETKTLMLANGRVEYAFTVIDPAVPPEVRIGPRRTLMALLGLVIGAILGSSVALVHNSVTRHRRATAPPRQGG